MTDITGFGSLGHLADLCRASGVSAEIDAEAVPLLPGALQYARQGFIPGGSTTNLAALEEWLNVDRLVEDAVLSLLVDPQTSGGLLVAIAPEMLDAFERADTVSDIAAVVGRLVEGPAGRITVRVSR